METTLHFYDPPKHDKVYIVKVYPSPTSPEWILRCEWGRRGASLQYRERRYFREINAVAAAKAIILQKEDGGYRVTHMQALGVSKVGTNIPNVGTVIKEPSGFKNTGQPREPSNLQHLKQRDSKKDPIDDRPRRKFRLD